MKKSNINEFIEKARKRHGDKFNYDGAIYINSETKILIKCNTCENKFYQTSHNHLKGRGCPTCGFKNSIKNRTFTRKIFLEKSKKAHGHKYNYDESDYIDNHTKIKIFCVKCKEFFYQIPANHFRGMGCPICAAKKNGIKKRTGLNNFIKKAENAYGDKYNYKYSIYINAVTKIDIYCNICKKIFSQLPGSHLSGSGCPLCANKNRGLKRRKGIENFRKEAEKIHGDKYNYNNSIYIEANTVIEISCNKCKKIFFQTPHNHLSGQNCPFCSYTVSRPSQEWLDSLNNVNIKREKTIYVDGRRFRLDGIDFENKIIYELNGDFYHGNPEKYTPDKWNSKCKKTMGELYQKTIEKKEYLEKHGYTVISIWESEWNEFNNKEKKC